MHTEVREAEPLVTESNDFVIDILYEKFEKVLFNFYMRSFVIFTGI